MNFTSNEIIGGMILSWAATILLMRQMPRLRQWWEHYISPEPGGSSVLSLLIMIPIIYVAGRTGVEIVRALGLVQSKYRALDGIGINATIKGK